MPSVLNLAAPLPGELDLLAGVVADLSDHTAKLVYADWLDERSDPRGGWLREFVDALQVDGRQPDAGEFPAQWVDAVGQNIQVQLRAADWPDPGRVWRLARPAVGIETRQSSETAFTVGETKFGGLPSLPRDMPWPRCEKGPLEFLAQFDLAEVSRTLAGRWLPSAGLLSFFMYHNYPKDAYGERKTRGAPGGLRIIHTPPHVDLGWLNPPDDLTPDCGRPGDPCEVALTDVMDLPGKELLRPPDEWETIYLVRDYAHQLFGYSHITVLANDPTPGPDWVQLVRFDSDRELTWGWRDGHRLFWYIRSDDLRDCRFDRTVAVDG